MKKISLRLTMFIFSFVLVCSSVVTSGWIMVYSISSAFEREGGDERASLSEHEYISKAYGVLGYAIRAFVPVMDEEGVKQVGVVVVGILAPTFQALLLEYQNDILLSLVWGLAIGLLGSWLLANNIKRQTFNLEPYEIAKLVEERSAVMQAMDIGIIATDANHSSICGSSFRCSPGTNSYGN